MNTETEAERILLEALWDMVEQHCSTGNGNYDSMALWANADAMRLCAKYGLCEIIDDDGSRIIFAKIT